MRGSVRAVAVLLLMAATPVLCLVSDTWLPVVLGAGTVLLLTFQAFRPRRRVHIRDIGRTATIHEIDSVRAHLPRAA